MRPHPSAACEDYKGRSDYFLKESESGQFAGQFVFELLLLQHEDKSDQKGRQAEITLKE